MSNMKESFLLELAAKRRTPLLLLLSVWVLYRGHNAPGGGFIGGLLAASGIGFYSLAFGPDATRALVRINPRGLMASGVLVALAAGLLAWFSGQPFLTGLWTQVPFPGEALKLGTPLLFDLGVYFAIIGVTVSILLDLEED